MQAVSGNGISRSKSFSHMSRSDFLRDVERGVSLRKSSIITSKEDSNKSRNLIMDIKNFDRNSMKRVSRRDAHRSFDTMVDIERMEALESWLDVPYDRTTMNTRNDVLRSIRGRSKSDTFHPRELRRTKSLSLRRHIDAAEASSEITLQMTCSICYSSFTTKKRQSCISFSSGYDYCNDCTSSYLEVQIADANICQNGSIFCVCRNSNCPNSYSPQDIETRVSDSNVMEKYHRYAALRAVALDPTKRWCPSTTCHEILTVPPGARRIRCHVCSTELCLRCNASHNKFVSCSMGLDSGFRNWVAHTNQGCKRCPSCRMYIEKNEGCQHMTCASCRHEFCWTCQAPWSHGCSNNRKICTIYRLINHPIWGSHPAIRAITKSIGLPLIAGVGIGGIATAAGVVAGGAIAGAGLALSASPVIGSYVLYKRYINSRPPSDRWTGEDVLMSGIRFRLPISSNDERFLPCYEPNPQFLGINGRLEHDIFIGFSFMIDFGGTAYNPLVYFVPNNVPIERQIEIMPNEMLEVTLENAENLPLALEQFSASFSASECSYFITTPRRA